jgi:hypothetical protein
LDDAAKRGRRVVLDEARRKVERALAVAEPAEELAQAAQAVLMAAQAEQIDFDSMSLSVLRAALAKYRAARGG